MFLFIKTLDINRAISTEQNEKVQHLSSVTLNRAIPLARILFLTED